jgi:hypothetical protein
LIEIGRLVLENILKNVQYFFSLLLYFPLERGIPLHLNISESPPLKDDLCQVWSKLAVVSEKKLKM